MQLKNWINYWRASLADGESINIDASNIEPKYKPEHFDPAQSSLAPELFASFWPENELAQLKENEIQEKEVLLAPLALVPSLRHRNNITTEEAIVPYWIPATISSRNQLRPGHKEYPLIPRKILEPSAYKDIVFSSVETVDRVFAQADSHHSNWPAYYRAMEQLFQKITGESFDSYPDGEACEVKRQWLVIPDDYSIGASVHILELYNQLRKKTKLPELLYMLAGDSSPALRPTYTPDEVLGQAKQHLGQMSKRFGLSPSQRQALSHFNELPNGEVLAVNGPPGTGKTTLIQSVIADGLIKAALRGGDPHITVASSTNNQAITNIIDSFKQPQTDASLENRWLPQVNSFALYLVSNTAERVAMAKANQWLYHTTYQGESSLSQLENHDYLRNAKAGFLNHFEAATGKKNKTLDSARDYLQSQVKWHTEQLQQGLSLWGNYSAIDLGITDPDEAWFEKAIAKASNWLAKLLAAQQQAPFYYILDFIPAIRRRKTAYFQLALHDCPYADFSSAGQLQASLLQRSENLKKAFADFKAFQDWKNQFTYWQTVNFKLNDTEKFLLKLDITLRYQAFWHAVHYWEARWLEATDTALKNDSSWKNTENGTIDRLRRFAMLCPCFVSTFHMLPKMLQYTLYPSKNIAYLYDFLDLLIVDEAGQVSPEVGAPGFALAKKALVVGDNYQIEPVWNVDGKTDEGNLKKYNLYNAGDQTAMVKIMEQGFMASNGNLLKLAQKSTPYAVSAKQRGLLLTEHRRCLNEIIAYCNALVYDKQLQPLSGHTYVPTDLLPPIGYLDIKGEAQKTGSSRCNYEEAKQLVDWLKNHESAIIDWIYQKERQESQTPDTVKHKPLHALVGIVTPFAAQKRQLTRALQFNGYQPREFQYGTVHSLQGAEKEIVFFSPVYTAGQQQHYFFDQGPNMLNVAVSRAKRSFIVAGDIALFNPKKQSPSGILAGYILGNPVNLLD
ncbi:MAG: DEAD/DEAH box helicase [Bacteroidota bacterium]